MKITYTTDLTGIIEKVERGVLPPGIRCYWHGVLRTIEHVESRNNASVDSLWVTHSSMIHLPCIYVCMTNESWGKG